MNIAHFIRFFLLLGFVSGQQPAQSAEAGSSERAILVFTKYEHEKKRHKITPFAAKVLDSLGRENDFTVRVTDNAGLFNSESLAQFAAVLLLNARGDVLTEAQQKSFRSYIGSGNGVIVVHAALLMEEDWTWFAELVGAKFADHPKIQPGRLYSVNPDHKANSKTPQEWWHSDEWYNFISPPQDVTTLVCVDETTYEGGKHGAVHPLAWCREYRGSRMFYTALGHTKDAWQNVYFLQHLVSGIEYAITPGGSN